MGIMKTFGVVLVAVAVAIEVLLPLIGFAKKQIKAGA